MEQTKDLQKPLPKPRKGESKKDFISRCMSNKAMQREFPEQEQRVAVCHTQWRRVHGGKPPKKKYALSWSETEKFFKKFYNL